LRPKVSATEQGIAAVPAKGTSARAENDMTNSKLQAALDELERLCETVKGFKQRNGSLPNTDSDAGRALSTLVSFTNELNKLSVDKLVKP
jgi:hypothetical protein